MLPFPLDVWEHKINLVIENNRLKSDLFSQAGNAVYCHIEGYKVDHDEADNLPALAPEIVGDSAELEGLLKIDLIWIENVELKQTHLSIFK